MIYEKLDTIAILKAIGFNSSDVSDFHQPSRSHWTNLRAAVGLFMGLPRLF